MSKFKAGQTYKTRNGLDVKLFATENTSGNRLFGLVNEDGIFDSMSWEQDGRFTTDHESPYDLIQPIKHWYMLVYLHSQFKKECSLLFDSEKEREEWINKHISTNILKTFEAEKP